MYNEHIQALIDLYNHFININDFKGAEMVREELKFRYNVEVDGDDW